MSPLLTPRSNRSTWAEFGEQRIERLVEQLEPRHFGVAQVDHDAGAFGRLDARLMHRFLSGKGLLSAAVSGISFSCPTSSAPPDLSREEDTPWAHASLGPPLAAKGVIMRFRQQVGAVNAAPKCSAAGHDADGRAQPSPPRYGRADGIHSRQSLGNERSRTANLGIIVFALSGSWRDGTAAICTWLMSGKCASKQRMRSPPKICTW